MPARIVLIGPADSLPALQERLDPTAEVQTFTDSEALEALDHIMTARPDLVAMQDEFSETSRGMALINRIKDDPALSECEVRVMAKNAAKNRVAVKRGGQSTGPAVAVDEATPAPALDQKGTRRAPRIRIKDGVEVAVDGNPAALIDLSAVGVQIVSPTVLKPNQRVRVQIGDAKNPIKCSGSIAWAAFEMPKGQATRYRAGVDFGLKADAAALDGYAKKNKKD